MESPPLAHSLCIVVLREFANKRASCATSVLAIVLVSAVCEQSYLGRGNEAGYEISLETVV